MTSSERCLCALRHEEPDRVPIHDSPWGTTIERWHREGLPENVGPHEYFGYELSAIGADTSFRFPAETVEDTDEYVVARDANGALRRNWKHATSTPECIDFLIKTQADWNEHRPRLAMSRDRIDFENGLKSQAAVRESGQLWCYSGAIGYDKTQGIVGSQNLLVAMLDNPGWVYEMFMAGADLIVETAEEMMAGGFAFDAAFLYDDMGYRNGLLFSPRAYRELLFPAHKRACDLFRSRGLPIILHSCGGVAAIVPDLIDAGFTCLQPLEVKAGMDLVRLKREFGDRLAFMGGIDVRVMARGKPEEIEEEVGSRLTVAKQGGGYIYHSDHSVPDNVSFESYQFVMEMVMKYGRYG